MIKTYELFTAQYSRIVQAPSIGEAVHRHYQKSTEQVEAICLADRPDLLAKVDQVPIFEPGNHVTYIPPHEKERPDLWEHGIIKSALEGREAYFVVFHCGGNWDDYENYTGQSTHTSNLVKGWRKEADDGKD